MPIFSDYFRFLRWYWFHYFSLLCQSCWWLHYALYYADDYCRLFSAAFAADYLMLRLLRWGFLFWWYFQVSCMRFLFLRPFRFFHYFAIIFVIISDAIFSPLFLWFISSLLTFSLDVPSSFSQHFPDDANISLFIIIFFTQMLGCRSRWFPPRLDCSFSCRFSSLMITVYACAFISLPIFDVAAFFL